MIQPSVWNQNQLSQFKARSHVCLLWSTRHRLIPHSLVPLCGAGFWENWDRRSAVLAGRSPWPWWSAFLTSTGTAGDRKKSWLSQRIKSFADRGWYGYIQDTGRSGRAFQRRPFRDDQRDADWRAWRGQLCMQHDADIIPVSCCPDSGFNRVAGGRAAPDPSLFRRWCLMSDYENIMVFLTFCLVIIEVIRISRK